MTISANIYLNYPQMSEKKLLKKTLDDIPIRYFGLKI